MSHAPTPDLLEPQWFIPVFAILWFGVSALLSLMSGWISLASGFRSTSAVQGQMFRFVSGSMGAAHFPVNYGNCLFVSVTESGFYLSVFFMFRFLSPPLFIPWTQVESVSPGRFLFMRYTTVRIRGHWARVSLYGKAGKAVPATYERAYGKRAL